MFAIGFVGILVLLLVGLAVSTNRRAINFRTVGLAFVMQMAIGALVLYVPMGRKALEALSHGVHAVLDSGKAGVNFLFGNLVNFSVEGIGFVFALNVLPLVVFFSALIAVLYYLGVMQFIIRTIGGLVSKALGTSQAESMSAVANAFVGQSEAPLVVKPYMPKMSDSEFFAIMCGGMASVSGTVLAGYAMMGVDMQYLLAASFMAVPGGILFAKLILPETTTPDYVVEKSTHFSEKRPENMLAAAGEGAASGLKLAAAIGGMLIAMIGLVTLVNTLLASLGGAIGMELSLELILGWIFAPLAFLLGVPMADIDVAGALIGKKLIINEFVAYSDLAPYLKDTDAVLAAGKQLLDEKTKVIVSFALCGFANVASIGILIGGLGTLCPSRSDFIARFGVRTLIAATCSNLMSAAIAGIFFSLA
ncbi:NupC/NupG family nucleoside CNT transporter [Ferrimonas balearica]|uniref:NupC/NupG family nucleoside CNT transporter n=1 Tax=Ferrimonas balearica TaxID=44012 RepID=UPI001C5628AF|nr:NupC/NupG family nucleoside CNT transporter [Ferrimonas balearica]MBW3164110.1 NupC/NupG family nucleoside CNT transporter [Ferrimonas balearica]MBY6105404.1 NupC/NupG family nucleoside CNT transporter [Ferrimonas balearica]MBY6224083.1 NupC/NupG family nucleoside CNT transporter [Ferrimonas balearica]